MRGGLPNASSVVARIPMLQAQLAIMNPVTHSIRESIKAADRDGAIENVSGTTRICVERLREIAGGIPGSHITGDELDQIARAFGLKLRKEMRFEDHQQYLEIEAAAYHEAGHAVAACVLGVTATDTSEIVVTWSAKALTAEGRAPHIPLELEIDRFAAILLAGPLSECKLRALRAHALEGRDKCRDRITEIRFAPDESFDNFIGSVQTICGLRQPQSSASGSAELRFRCEGCAEAFSTTVRTQHSEGDLRDIRSKLGYADIPTSFLRAAGALVDDASHWERIVAVAKRLHAEPFMKRLDAATIRSLITCPPT